MVQEKRTLGITQSLSSEHINDELADLLDQIDFSPVDCLAPNMFLHGNQGVDHVMETVSQERQAGKSTVHPLVKGFIPLVEQEDDRDYISDKLGLSILRSHIFAPSDAAQIVVLP